jgi:sigma-B regulation protein RsbU (phosphoserine phosphatase)
MGSRFKSSYITRFVVLLAGAALLILIAFLTWAGLVLPNQSRLPVPSPDGEYFAYFNPTQRAPEEGMRGYELDIASRRGGLVAHISVDPGAVVWSNAGHLAVINHERTAATVIVNTMTRFLVLARLELSPGAEPRWSRDGNKLAFRRPGPQGDEIAIYDVQQTQVLPVAFPPDFRLHDPLLLFWSPGSDFLYLLNQEGDDVVLDRLDLAAAEIKSLARGLPGRGVPGAGLPRMSPDGTKVQLPPPLSSIVDAQSGETIWNLPTGANPLWSPWSADGRRLFYWRGEDRTQIYAHDLSSQSEEIVARNVQPNGFVTLDARSFLFRLLPDVRQDDSGVGRSEWLKPSWGWQQMDLTSQVSQSLGRLEIYPWEQTLSGSILARQDDYVRVRYGLYNPSSRALSEYAFPTARDDVARAANSHRLTLWFAAFYVVLAFVVFFRRPRSAPVGAFFILAFLGTVTLTGRAALESAWVLEPPYPFRVQPWEIAGLGWWIPQSLARFLTDEIGPAMVYLWALMPPALVYFAISFPENNRFLAARKMLWAPLYLAASVPLVGLLITKHADPAAGWKALPLIWIAGPAVLAIVVVGLIQNFRWPGNRRAREQVRWAGLAAALASVGGLLLLLANGAALRFPLPWVVAYRPFFNDAVLVVVGLLSPLALGHALTAAKPYDIRLLVRQIIRFCALGGPAVVIFLLFAAAMSWATGGPPREPSVAVLIAAALLTEVVLAPSWSPYQRLLDRTLDRAGYTFRERLEDLARGLPHILDRKSLAASLGERIQIEMGTTRFYLFLLDRQSKKLRAQAGKSSYGMAVADVEFDPEEPLSRYLMEEQRVFEVEVSPFNPKLIPVFRSVADRLGKLRAAVVLGLKRRQTLLGLMVLGPKASDDFYNGEELDLLTKVADQAAVAVENIELFEDVTRSREHRKELADASEMQTMLFPSIVPGLSSGRIAGRCVPARSVSGDYYDFLRLPDKRVGLAIADVSGRGMAASLLMANLQGLLRSQAPTAESLEDLMRRINRQIFNSSFGAKHCTLFYGVYDDARRELQFVNAGHSPPILLTSAGPRFLESTGLPLGLFAEATPESRHESLEPGAILVLYSDGITEARNTRGDAYGGQRLIDVLSRFQDSDVGRIADRVLGDVSDFMAGATIEDDQTLVLLKVNPA